MIAIHDVTEIEIGRAQHLEGDEYARTITIYSQDGEVLDIVLVGTNVVVTLLKGESL